MKLEVDRYATAGGQLIYRIPLHLFPELWGFVYLVKTDDMLLLVDAGSGFGQSNDQLDAGMDRIRDQFQESFDWSDLTHVLISHGHIDHFGGLHFIRERTAASIGVHELDAPILERYEQAIALSAKKFKQFLLETGLPSREQEDLLDLYLLNHGLFRSIPIDFTYGSIGMRLGPFSFKHVPGHSPGQVVIQLEDVLFTADHVLPDISPHLAPECLAFQTGLSHYLESLESLYELNGRVRFSLPGHGEPIPDLKQRTVEIIRHHHARLLLTGQLVSDQARSISEISEGLFPGAEGFHRIFALEETAAHVEFLEQLGHLEIENFQELEATAAVPVYRRVDNQKTMRITWFEPYAGGSESESIPRKR